MDFMVSLSIWFVFFVCSLCFLVGLICGVRISRPRNTVQKVMPDIHDRGHRWL